MPEFQNAENEIIIRPMIESDADAVAQLYKKISVTNRNYKKVLSDSDESFSHRGGMFLISSKEDILKILSDRGEKIIVGLYEGEVCGMLWYGPFEETAFPELSLFPDCSDLDKYIKDGAKSGSLAYAKEIISQPPKSAGVMAYALFYTMMTDFSSHSIKNAIGEVYRVDSYDDESGHTDCGLLNMPSYNLLIRSGGHHIGTSAVKNIAIDNFCVHITPQVMLWDTADSAEKIIGSLSTKGWELTSP